ncbi:MAG: exopolysaccharide biosynthesis protein [Clostridium sp.]|jgi:exopolysaccharide biosynthesis protein
MRKMKKCGKTKRNTGKIVLLFLIFELVFTASTGPFMVYYGPFKKVKTTVVGAAMTTLTLQWLATSFMSDEKIKEIMSEQTVDVIAQNNLKGENPGVVVENKDDNSIERYDVSVANKFAGYLLVVNDPTRLRVGFSTKLGIEGERTSEIAKNNNAIAGINGGAFTDDTTKWAGTGANPSGIIMANGKVEHNDITNDNEKTEVIALTKSGNLLVGKHSFNEMKEKGVTDAVSFGPALIVNGRKTISSGDGGWGIAGRTAIAQRQDGAIMLLVIDGRQLGSIGASLKDVQDVLYENGAVNASNLDGGSSSTMFYNDEVINSPSDSLGERSVPSIIYVESRK